MTAVASASMMTAGMSTLAMLVVVVIAADIWIVGESAGQQSVYRSISIAAYASVEPDTGFRQSHLSTASDAAADQRIDAMLHQKAGQRTVAAAIGVNDFGMSDFAVQDFVKLELLGMSEMLKNLSVFIGNCDFHST